MEVSEIRAGGTGLLITALGERAPEEAGRPRPARSLAPVLPTIGGGRSLSVPLFLQWPVSGLELEGFRINVPFLGRPIPTSKLRDHL